MMLKLENLSCQNKMGYDFLKFYFAHENRIAQQSDKKQSMDFLIVLILLDLRNLQEQVKKHSVTKNCSDLSLFE